VRREYTETIRIFLAAAALFAQSGCRAPEESAADDSREVEAQLRTEVSGSERNFDELHRADVARYLSDPDSVPVEAFTTITGAFRFEGKPPTDFEVGYKPGILSGSDSWETVVETLAVNASGLKAISAEIHPGEPLVWRVVNASEEGRFSIPISEACETATIFVRTSDGKVVTRVVKGLERGVALANLEIVERRSGEASN
jgi:hypothetical protein